MQTMVCLFQQLAYITIGNTLSKLALKPDLFNICCIQLYWCRMACPFKAKPLRKRTIGFHRRASFNWFASPSSSSSSLATIVFLIWRWLCVHLFVCCSRWFAFNSEALFFPMDCHVAVQVESKRKTLRGREFRPARRHCTSKCYNVRVLVLMLICGRTLAQLRFDV